MMRDPISVPEAAALIGVEPSTLYSWRARNTGPVSGKRGGKVVFERAVVLAWIEKQDADTARGAA